MTICSLLVICICALSGHDHRLSLAPDHGHRLSLSWSWGFALSRHDHRLSLSPGHGHRLSIFLLVMAIDCLSLSPGHGHRLSLSLLVMAINCLSLPPLIVEICSLSASLDRGDLLSLSLLVVEICSFSFSHSLWVRATCPCPCPSLDHGHLFSPSVFLWEIHTFFSLSVGHKHLLLFSSGHCHLFSIFFSPLTTVGCSLLFPQKKHLLSLPYLPWFSFLCYLNLSTSVSVPFLAAMTCINLS